MLSFTASCSWASRCGQGRNRSAGRARRWPVRVTHAKSSIDIDAMLESLEIADDLQSMQEKLGGVIEGDIVVSFGEENDRKASEAWEHGVVLVDRSHWGRIRVAGSDHIEFLHGQTTADIKKLQPGGGCQAVFATPTGRTIDAAGVLCQGKGCTVVVSPNTQGKLLERLDKHIFPMDDVTATDFTAQTRMFTVLGPAAEEVLAEWGAAGQCAALPPDGHAVFGFEGAPVVVWRSSGLGRHLPGWTFIVDESVAAEFWRKVALQGAIPMGAAVWERVRVRCGVPAAGAELTDKFNALEAGMHGAISLDKGCYIGQETLAKVTNLNALKQRLWQLRLRAGTTCAVGDVIATEDGAAVGRVTSVATLEGDSFALGYIKSKVAGEWQDWEGRQVAVGDTMGKVQVPPALQDAWQ
eukprot:jgi/Ulvmu1/9232/UM005_0332.1